MFIEIGKTYTIHNKVYKVIDIVAGQVLYTASGYVGRCPLDVFKWYIQKPSAGGKKPVGQRHSPIRKKF